LEKIVTDDKQPETPDTTDHAATSEPSDTPQVVETQQETLADTTTSTSENARGSTNLKSSESRVSNSSDAEEIRQLLKDVPTRSESGTITFTKNGRPIKKKRNRSGWGVIRFFLLALILLGLGAILYIRQQLSPVTSVSTPTEFEVEPGWGASRVASELEDAGLIRNARIFSFYLRRQNLDRNIGEGLYDLDPAMNVATIATTLNQGGRPRVVKVVVPEGFRMKDIAKELATAGLFDEATFQQLFENAGSLRPSFVGAGKPLEGYLFPASYEIPVRSTAEEIVGMFLDRFGQELTPEITQGLEERGWTVPGWVTLASIVQAEAANTSEMPIIAGVFLNRLEDGMPLQSDPTVAYGLEKDLPELDRSAGDFENDNPWNTYLYAGLPSTPINNPGLEALQAVLNPERNNEEGQAYFYFLHGTDEGQPVFRVNLNFDDHLRDVEQYLR
jgi:UPF0755 protein